jgi:hypothetical protein
MRWPILAGLCLLASPVPALADAPSYTCAKAAPHARLTVQFSPDLTLHDLGTWVTGFTCKSVVYDAEAAAKATKLSLIAPSAVTSLQAVQLFVDAIKKAGLAVVEKPDAFVITDPAPQRRCPARPVAPRASGGSACARPAADAMLTISFKPDTSLDDLATWVSAFTCKPVRFDPAIGTGATMVNLIVSAQVTPKQATRLFLDAVESTGLVVTEKADGFDVKPGPRWSHCPTAAPSMPSTPSTPSTPTTPPDDAADDLTAAIDAGIRKIDDTHYEIKKALVDKILMNPMAVVKGARVVPAMKDGKPEGFKLYAIRPTSAFARLGLTNGDTLRTINGHALDSADKALEVYTKIRDAKRLEVEIIRRGKPLTLTYTIVK